MFDLKTTLLKFKDDSLALINCLELENYNTLEDLMNDRQSLINTMNNYDIDKQQFEKLYKEYEIAKLDSKIHDIMSDRMKLIKSELQKIKLSKNLNNNYNVKAPVDSIFFNKKI